MRLLLLSDLHLEFSDLRLPETLDFDVALLAGDIVCPGHRLADWVAASPALRRARAVIAVAGNHEYFDGVLQEEACRMRRAAASVAQPPLHWLDASAVVVDGVRFLGCTLWTDFALRIQTAAGPVSDPRRGLSTARQRMADYRLIGWQDGNVLRRLTPEDTVALHATQRAWLEAALQTPFDGPTVVITHHGPHRGSLVSRHAADWVSAAYLNEFPERFFDVPCLWLHGHTHASSSYAVGSCRVVCNPRGYTPPGALQPENAQFDPCLVHCV